MGQHVSESKVYFKSEIDIIQHLWYKILYCILHILHAQSCYALFCCNSNISCNPLWPGDAIWPHISGSALVEAMAWCLMAPNHYLSQCWHLISEVNIKAISNYQAIIPYNEFYNYAFLICCHISERPINLAQSVIAHRGIKRQSCTQNDGPEL